MEELAIYCQRVFGEIGLLLETGDYPAVKKPSRPTNTDYKNDDEKEFALIEYRAEYDKWSERAVLMEKQKIRVFAVIMGQLSKESKVRLKQVKTWEDIDRAKCPK